MSLDSNDFIIPLSVPTISAATGLARVSAPVGLQIVGVSASLGTTVSAAALVADVNIGGTTIFTTQANRPTVAIGALGSATVAKPDNLDGTVAPVATTSGISAKAEQIRTLGAYAAPGALITVDVDTPGTGGANLTLLLHCRRA